MSNLAFAPLAITFTAFALCLILQNKTQQKITSIVFSLLYTLSGGAILFLGDATLTLQLNMGGWSAPFGISLVYDRLAALLIAVTGVVYFAVMLYAKTEENAEKSHLFFPLIHILICGVSGAFITGDLFNLYVWFEVILISSFVLLTLESDALRLSGALKYVVLNMLSSLVFLLGAGLVYNAAHTLNIADLAPRLQTLSVTDGQYVTALNAVLFVAFALKSSLFPFFFWLPASYHTLSPALSGLFAGLLTKVGLYAIYRVNLFAFPNDDFIQMVLIITACLSILLGVFGAIIQTNIRRILGFHIISQVGYIALAGVFAFSDDETLRHFGIAAGFFYMVHHIIVKANLYLVSGLIGALTGSEHLSKVSGLIKSHNVLAVLFAIPALSLAGIPPLSGFWAKLGVFQASLSVDAMMLVAVMVVGGFFTVFSMAKIWLGAFWGQPTSDGTASRPVSKLAIVACFFLSSITLTIGLAPDLLFEKARHASEHLIMGGTHGNR